MWGPGMYMKMALVPKGTRAIHLSYGAGDGNRTRVISLEGWGSTIELHPHFNGELYITIKLAVRQADSFDSFKKFYSALIFN